MGLSLPGNVFLILPNERLFSAFVLDLPQVDCENAKASDSQDDESEGRSHKSTCSACRILNLICILLVPKKMVVT